MALESIKQHSFSSVRKQTYIEADPAGAAKTYNLMNIRGDANTWETGAETETINDVTQKVQPTEITSVAPSLSVSQLALTDDPVYLMFKKMFDTNATAADTHRKILRVEYTDDFMTTISEVYSADATVQVTSFPNEAGSNSRVEATITAASDWVKVETSSVTQGDGIVTLS